MRKLAAAAVNIDMPDAVFELLLAFISDIRAPADNITKSKYWRAAWSLAPLQVVKKSRILPVLTDLMRRWAVMCLYEQVQLKDDRINALQQELERVSEALNVSTRINQVLCRRTPRAYLRAERLVDSNLDTQ